MTQKRRSEPVFIRPGLSNQLVKVGGPSAAGRAGPVILTSGYIDIRSGNASLRLINSASSVGFNVTNDTKMTLFATAGTNGGLFHLPDDSLGFTSGMVLSLSSDGKAKTNVYCCLGVQRVR